MAKQTTNAYRQIDIRNIPSEKLRSGEVFTYQWYSTTAPNEGELEAQVAIIPVDERDAVRLDYTTSPRWGDGEEHHRYPVVLDWTDCHFGGERPWWKCPEQRCGRRCAILYGGEVFVCRECRDLTYRRCQISGNDALEARHKMRKLERKYQDDDIPDMIDRLGTKPKHMHRDTWREIQDEYRTARAKFERAIVEKTKGLSDEIKRIIEDA